MYHIVDMVFYRAQKFVEIGPVGAQTAKHEAAIDRNARHFRQIETTPFQETWGIAIGIGPADMAAVHLVNPAMIGAFQSCGVTLELGANLGAPMEAAIK